MVVTSSVRASRCIEIASRPSTSAMRMAARTICCVVRLGLGPRLGTLFSPQSKFGTGACCSGVFFLFLRGIGLRRGEARYGYASTSLLHTTSTVYDIHNL